jgi:menaquinone-specific isochorismate synthase
LGTTDNMGFITDFLHNGSIITFQGKDLLIGWGTREWNAARPRDQKTAFYFPDFFLEDSQPWFFHKQTQVISVGELLDSLSRFPEKCSEKLVWTAPDHHLYSSIFHELKNEYLQAGSLQKGVPFSKSEAQGKMPPSRIAESLISMLQVYKHSSCYLYGFWDQHQGVLGASPEVLFRKEEGDEEVQTVACAGTCASNAQVSAFLSDPKELMEHQYVIEGIKECLSPYGKLSVQDMKVLHLPHLKHLYTPITLQSYKNVGFEELVKSLHPTPALGAYPKEIGNDWLKTLQKKIDRYRFGAPVGFVSEDKDLFACYVGIRNAQWNENQVSIFAGGGVVSQSELDKEWNEILLKLRTVKKMLALETLS